jgi:hypothetical protein
MNTISGTSGAGTSGAGTSAAGTSGAGTSAADASIGMNNQKKNQIYLNRHNNFMMQPNTFQ